LSAWANAGGNANRKAKETMQAITLTRVFIEPPLGTVVKSKSYKKCKDLRNMLTTLSGDTKFVNMDDMGMVIS